MQKFSSDGSSLAASSLQGKARGGEQAIVGGSVNLYATTTVASPASGNNYGYGSGGSAALSTTTTDSNGNFTLPAYTCPSGQQAYVTITGGTSGGTQANSQILLLAALGACGGPNFPAFIDVDEVSTVAAAYALSNFISIDGSEVVHVSAPAANNNTGTGTTTAAAGLPHAFLNAATLENIATGVANTAVPGTPGTGGITGSVPQAEIHTIANIIQGCVNSNGSGTTGTSTASFTTPTAPLSGSGASSTLTASNAGDYVYGSLAVSIAGASATTFAEGPQTLTNFASLINSTSSIAGVFSTPTTPTGTVGASATVTFPPTSSLISLGAVSDISGTLDITVGSTLTPITVTAGTTLGALATQINGSGAGVTAATSGTTLTVTGPVGATNTLSFAGSALSDSLQLTAGVVSNVLTLTGPVGTSNTMSLSGTSLTDNTDSTSCGALFALTPSLTGSNPSNTLQAAVNMAKNPWVSATNVTNLFGLIPAQVAFTPTLATAPLDWNISVTYKLTSYPTNCSSGGCSNNSYPLSMTLDANDNAYVLNQNVSSATGANIYSFTSNGVNSYVSNAIPFTNPNVSTLRQIVADNAGSLWVSAINNGTNTATVQQFSQAAGAFINKYNSTATGIIPIGIAVDKLNNVWLSSNTTTTTNTILFQIPTCTIGNTGCSSSGWKTTPVAITTAPQGSSSIAIDANQNIWYAGDTNTTNGDAFVYANQNITVTPPTYSGSLLANNAVNVASGYTDGGIAIDASGNAWITTKGGTIALNKVSPTYTGNTVTSITAGPSYNPSTAFSIPNSVEIDGASVAWVGEAGNKGLVGFNTLTTSFFTPPTGLKPCLVVSGACATEGASGAISNVRNVVIDSTGSLWISSLTAMSAIQMIGTANPTWPLLATGKPGTLPY